MNPQVAQEAPTPEWIDKHEAAKRTGLSWQRLFAIADDHPDQLHSRKEHDPKTRQLVRMLHAGDIERICYDREHPEPKEPLTRRENAIVSAVTSGSSNGQIATKLSLPEDSVESLLNRVYEKLGVGDRLQLIIQALTRNPAIEAEREAAARFERETAGVVPRERLR